LIFFALLGYSVGIFLPWWFVIVWSFTLGTLLPRGWSGACQASLAAAIVWAVAAFYLNGFSHGLIAPRMAALFQLPSPYLIFFVPGALAALLALPAYWLGIQSKVLLKG
jgi:hypothetical protein